MSKDFDIQTMELELLILRHKDTPTKERRKVYLKMVELYKTSVEVRKEWKHHPSKHLYADRFERIAVKVKLKRHDDGQDYKNLPVWGGLYLLGMVTVDETDLTTPLYWIKSGKASHMNERLASYNTDNPHYKRLDLLRIDGSTQRSVAEKQTHHMLERVGIARCNHNEEWFLVTREVYLDIKARGFKYFFEEA